MMNNSKNNPLTQMNAAMGLLATLITFTNAQENQTALNKPLLPNTDDTLSEEKDKETKLILLLVGSVGFILMLMFLSYKAKICPCHDRNISPQELQRARLAQRSPSFIIHTPTTATISSEAVGIPIPNEERNQQSVINEESSWPPPRGYTGGL